MYNKGSVSYLLIYLAILSILLAISIVLPLNLNQSAKIKVVEDFLINKIPSVVLICIANNHHLDDCTKDDIVYYLKLNSQKQLTPWGDNWLVLNSPTALSIRYPLVSADDIQGTTIAIINSINKSSVGASVTFGVQSSVRKGVPFHSSFGANDLEIIYIRE